MAYYGQSVGAFGSAFGSTAPQQNPALPRTGGYIPPAPKAPPIATTPYMGGPLASATQGWTVTPGGAMDPNAKPPVNPATIDFSNDPILQRIRALAEQSVHDAEADALASRKRLAIGFGDADLAKQLGLGEGVQKQARENTFGTSQELARGKTRRDVFDITGKMSDQGNLFYSSTRGRALALSGEQYLRDKAMASAQVQEQLASISRALLQSKLAAQAQIIQGEQQAYQTALQYALYAAGAS